MSVRVQYLCAQCVERQRHRISLWCCVRNDIHCHCCAIWCRQAWIQGFHKLEPSHRESRKSEWASGVQNQCSVHSLAWPGWGESELLQFCFQQLRFLFRSKVVRVRVILKDSFQHYLNSITNKLRRSPARCTIQLFMKDVWLSQSVNVRLPMSFSFAKISMNIKPCFCLTVLNTSPV